MKYNPGLDTLRALAAISVVAFHYSRWGGWGWTGVPLFFVLSGYLITSVLLETKRNGGPFIQFAEDFFRRRGLRLLPVYLLFVFAACSFYWLEGSKLVLKDLPFLLTYTFNFEGLDHKWRDYGHLWSLSVEWQFYLLWPFAVWFFKEKTIRRILIGFLCVAPFVRAALVRWFNHHGETWTAACLDIYILPLTHIDSLAVGCLLAWGDFRSWFRSKNVTWGFVTAACALGLLVSVVGWRHGYWPLYAIFTTLGFPYSLSHFQEYIWGYSLIALLFGVLVSHVDLAAKLSSVFSWRWLSYLGKVSYGFYVFHFAILRMVIWGLAKVQHNEPLVLLHSSVWTVAIKFAGFIACVLLTFLLAHLSYQLWESRFLRLQRKKAVVPIPVEIAGTPS